MKEAKQMVFFRCKHCGNIVGVIKNGGGELVCCGEPMEKLEANVTDAAQEKHVPVASKEGGKLKVSVGSAAHPMSPEHYIEWIAVVADDKNEIAYLKPGMEPKAEFTDITSNATVYAYCNLHSLWKADV